MEKALELDVRRSGVGARRHHLYRRDLQGRREADLAKGAALADPSHLFNSSLEGNTRRAIDIHEGDRIDEKALLIRAAVALNTSARATARPARSQKRPKNSRRAEKRNPPSPMHQDGGLAEDVTRPTGFEGNPNDS
jgi:hypothetical protein